MEQSLLGQKQIRQYFKCFSEHQWNRVSRATMMLGIQYLSMHDSRTLGGDFSRLSLEELEDIVVENEVKLIQVLRQQQRGGRSRSRGGPDERGPSELTDGSGEKPPAKRVTLVDGDENKSSPAAPRPQGSSGQGSPNEKDAKDQQDTNADQVKAEPSPEKGGAPSKPDEEALFINVNRRHQRDFNKHKSSQAMSTLLKADEQVDRRRKQVATGAQVLSKVQFEARRNKDDPIAMEKRGILSNKTAKSKQPSQKTTSKQGAGVVFADEQAADSLERARPGSREPSKGRASSAWRQGVTQTSLERQAQESVRDEIQKKEQKLQYPPWWPGQDGTPKGPNRNSRSNSRGSRNRMRADPVKAKVYKNLNRYAEDSLDARIRRVQDNADLQPEMGNFQNYNTINMSGQPRRGEAFNVMFDQPGSHLQAAQHYAQPQHVVQSINHSPSTQNQNPVYALRNRTTQQQSLQSSKSYLGPQNRQGNLTGVQSATSIRDMNMLDSGHNQNMLNRTNGSTSSFAYTSNKRVPKYSPARQWKPGASNVPMSYSGPPNHEELNRNAARYASGNRNFNIHLESSEQLPVIRSGGQTLAASQRGQRGTRSKQSKVISNQPSKQDLQNQTANLYNDRSAYLQQQLETQKNRKKNENMHQNEYQVQDTDAQDGVRKYARGGVALTISSAPQEEREKSGSQPRYPYEDREPFQTQPRQDAPQSMQQQYAVKSQVDRQARPKTGKRIPKELNQVESSLKYKIEQDRRQYLLRQREQDQNQEAASYQNEMNGEEKDTSQNKGIQAQIFYKKDDSKVLYEEGQETYRNSMYHQQQLANNQYTSKQDPQGNDMEGINGSNGQSLRRRTISPQTMQTIHQQYKSTTNIQSKDNIQYPETSSYDLHNETGFTNKLMAQQPQYAPHQPQQYNPNVFQMQYNQKNQVDNKNQYQAYFGQQNQANDGYYRQSNYNDSQGQVKHFQDSPGENGLSSGDKNNTSRFAFSNDHKQQESSNNQNQPQQNGSTEGGPNSSTFNDQSLVTPNLSYGGKKLQNQLEQVLMMKSGEFSAGGPRNHAEMIDDDAFDQHGRPLYPIHQNDQYPSQAVGQSNYGNPNFVPPPQFVHPGQTKSFNPSHQQFYNQQQHSVQEFNQFSRPRAYQDHDREINSSSHNFNTSQFPGNEYRSNEDSHYRGYDVDSNPQQRFVAAAHNGMGPGVVLTGNNFTLQRPSAQADQEQLAASMGQRQYQDDPAMIDPRQQYYQNLQRGHQDQPGKAQPPMMVQPPVIAQPTMITQPPRELQEPPAQYYLTSNQQPIGPEKYYQTFNEDESRVMQKELSADKEERENQMQSEELSDYPGEDRPSGKESRGEDMGQSSQVSPSRDSPEASNVQEDPDAEGLEGGHRSSEDGEDEYEHTRTEHLRDFMEQAQPARGMLDSQGVSQTGANSSSVYAGQRKMAKEDLNSQPVQFQDRNTNNGKSLIQANTTEHSSAVRDPYRPLTNESSPEISNTDHPSGSSPSGARRYGRQGDMEDSPSSSIDESPESSKMQGQESPGDRGATAGIQNMHPHGQQLQMHLNQISVAYQEDPRGTVPAQRDESSMQEEANETSPSRSQPAESESLSPLRNSEL